MTAFEKVDELFDPENPVCPVIPGIYPFLDPCQTQTLCHEMMKKHFDEYVDVDTCSAKDTDGAKHAICNPPPPPSSSSLPQPSSSPALAGGACGSRSRRGSPQERCFCVWYPRLPRRGHEGQGEGEGRPGGCRRARGVPPLDKLRFKQRACRVFGGQLTIDTHTRSLIA